MDVDQNTTIRNRLLVAVSIALVFGFPNTVVAQTGADSTAPGKNYVEGRIARAADGGVYGFLNYNRQLNPRVSFDFVYVRSSGLNEAFVGFGFPLRVTKQLTVTPLVYGVFGESGEAGVAVGATVAGVVKRFNVSGFVGHFQPVKGPTKSYTFIDTFDVTRTLGAKWEAGASTKLFSTRNLNVGGAGPVVKYNDQRGATAVSARFGSGIELQLTRIFMF